MTRLRDVTPFGARVVLVHPTEIGRLLHLTMPLPRQLRCFDHVEEQYRIWSLVRNVTLVEEEQQHEIFEVGVAFIGKRPPATFEEDPAIRYETGPTSSDSLYTIRPAAPRKNSRSQETRLRLPIEVVLEVVNTKGEIAARETTVTENISRRGAAVYTALLIDRGRFIRVTSLRYNLAVTAVVRARRQGDDGLTRLHLEFVTREWPLEGIE